MLRCQIPVEPAADLWTTGTALDAGGGRRVETVHDHPGGHEQAGPTTGPSTTGSTGAPTVARSPPDTRGPAGAGVDAVGGGRDRSGRQLHGLLGGAVRRAGRRSGE